MPRVKDKYTNISGSFDGPLINITVLTAALSVLIGLFLPLYWQEIHIVESPLSAIKFWSTVYTIWICVSLYWLQQQHPSSAVLNRGQNQLSYKSILQRILIAIVAQLSLHFLIVLFGAPAIEKATESAHLAMLMTVLGVMPALCTLNTSNWSRVYIIYSPNPGIECYAFGATLGTGIGTLLGAVPIPLDWDRPWQAWPISCAIGSIIGHIVGVCIATIHDTYSANKKNDFYKRR